SNPPGFTRISRLHAGFFDLTVMYTVYVLQSEKDGRLYKGFTKDLPRRIHEHNSGLTRSIKAYRPWKLVYSEPYSTLEGARRREKFFKTGEGRAFLKKKISSF
ncbi:MAG: GIY-YIG nuclease family protein, partial [Bacteroidota bacterium]